MAYTYDMKKNLGGRPKLAKGKSKAEVIAVRFSRSERRQIEEAAMRNKVSLSDWIRAVLLEASLAGRIDIPETEVEGIEPQAAATARPGGVKPL